MSILQDNLTFVFETLRLARASLNGERASLDVLDAWLSDEERRTRLSYEAPAIIHSHDIAPGEWGPR